MRVHNIGGKKIVAVCDEEILGAVFREGDKVLEISPKFYGGKRVDIDQIINEIRDADIVVISGRRIIEELDKRGIIMKEFALKVGDQLHIQIMKEVIEV